MPQHRPAALAVLSAALVAVRSAFAAEEPNPPIPIPFELKEPGYVTLVIERPDGTRVRNLISETPFEAGKQTAWWDGLDDLGRDVTAARHAVYNVPGKLVEAGEYRVRGLVRPEVRLGYEFTPYNPGNPPWRTGDTSNGWLANHTPASAVLWVPAGAAPSREKEAIDKTGWNGAPLANLGDKRKAYSGSQVLIASHVSEGGSGLAWVDLDGNKLHGQMWLGGIWTAASQLARDEGDKPVPGIYAYAAAYWHGDKYNKNIPEIRLHELVADRDKKPGDYRMGRGDDRAVLTPFYALPGVAKGSDNTDVAHAKASGLTGLAARNGLIVMSVGLLNRLVFVDGHQKKVVGMAELADPRGIAFDKQGRLAALSGNTLVRFSAPDVGGLGEFDVQSTTPNITLSGRETLVTSGLEEPQQIAIDSAGRIYVSDWGGSHQVKVFDAAGKPGRVIGNPGKPNVGKYDEKQMRHPNGLTIDERGRLWVAETDKAPKRVSVWNPQTGELDNVFYGPPKYGGGGNVDPANPARFFYTDDAGGIEFELDWKTGKDKVRSIYYHADVSDFPIRGKWVGYGPQTPLPFNGKTYLTDCYSTSATEGVRAASLWIMDDYVARPVAAVGALRHAQNQVFSVFQEPAFVARMPENTDPAKDPVMFAWSDLNSDGKMQPEETTYFRPPGKTANGPAQIEGVTVQPDLSFAIAIAGDQAIQLKPQGFSSDGVPYYDANKHEVLATGVNRKASSGHGQALVGSDGWTVLTTAPSPFSNYGIGGVKDGKPMWSYPSMWPGLHASHIAPLASKPGMLIGTTRLLGTTFTIDGTDIGDVFAIASNKGQAYLMTTDGLMLATLFNDCRTAEPWPAEEIRDADVSRVSLGEECFGPMFTKLHDGRLLMQGGFNSSLLTVTGLSGARRLPDTTVKVTREQLAAAADYFTQVELARQAEKGPTELLIPIVSSAPAVDGSLAEWEKASWVVIDQRNKKIGNFGRKPVKTEAALRISGDRLYGAIRTDDPELLKNSGEALQNIFKTGGAIDLMIGTNASAPADRKNAVAGDRRLIVTQVGKKPLAVLYEQVSAKGGEQPFEFTSPVSTVRFASVDDVTADVQLAIGKEDGPEKAFVFGLYEFSIPLKTLGLSPKPGAELRGDIGILRGNGYETTQRVYWTNKATGLTSDLPSEANLRPGLWGKFIIQAEGSATAK